MQIYKLRFLSALHVDSKGSGEPETADDFIRSDTLSAALCISWAAVFRKSDPAFYDTPPFTVSSAFPFIDNIRLFPVPVWQIWENMNPSKRKEFKKIRWISEGLFNQAADGVKIDFKSVHSLAGGIAVSHDEFKNLAPKLQKAEHWVIAERQRVSIDRAGHSSLGLFFFALQFFAPHSGLWFMADTEEPGKFRASLDFLGDTGIGADRNSGLGHFQVISEEDFKIKSSKKKNGWIIISLFNPGQDEDIKALTRKTAYGITTRSGWISNSTIGRPPVRVFTEGSYFSAKPKGRVMEMLTPEIREKAKLNLNHSVFRDFRAVFLPCAEPSGLKEVES